MAYQIEAIPITLSHVQGHSYCKPFKCAISYSCAAVDTISTDIVGYVEVAQLLSFEPTVVNARSDKILAWPIG